MENNISICFKFLQHLFPSIQSSKRSTFGSCNLVHVVFLALFVIVNTVHAQTSSESCEPKTFRFDGPPGNTLCSEYGGITFHISVGTGTAYPNSSQLPLLPANPKILIIGDFNVNTNLFWQGATIRINPGVAINISTGVAGPASLTLDNCDLFACYGLWKGIIMLNNGTTVRTLNGTQIEDAEGAIQSYNTQLTALEIENTTFNRNKKCIVIENTILMPKNIVATKFNGNILTCTAPLNGTVSDITEVGVQIKNIQQPFLNNALTFNNTFEKMIDGFKVEGDNFTTLLVNDFNFLSIKNDGINFWGKKLDVRNSVFDPIGGYGIYFQKSSELYLKDNEFYMVPIATPAPFFKSMVYSIFAKPGNNFTIDQNYFYTEGVIGPAGSTGFAIQLVSGSLSEQNASITRNVFDLYNASNEIPGMGVVAIGLAGGFIQPSQIHIENHNKFNTNPYITNSNIGVSLAGEASNVTVVGNDFSGGGTCVQFINSEGTGNKVIGNVTNLVPNVASNLGGGFNFRNFWHPVICSNVNNGTSLNGFGFQGKNYSTTMSGNTTFGGFENGMRIFTGLDPASLIGQQENTGNKWLPVIEYINGPSGDGFYFVRPHLTHNSTDPDIIEMSKFFVSTDQSVWNVDHYTFFSEYHPAIEEIVPDTPPLEDAFFTKFGTSESSNCVDQFTGGSPDKADARIADGSFATIVQNPIAVWDAKRYLYKKLHDEPNYVSAYTAFSTFLQNEQGSNVGKFYLLEKKIDEAMGLSATLKSTASSLANQSSILEGQLTSSSGTSSIQSLLMQKFVVDSNLMNVQMQHVTERNSKLLDALAIWQTITPQAQHEIYRKDVLGIFLAAQLNQGGEFTQSQIATLQSIAVLCVKNGGMAAPKAQSFLPPCALAEIQDQIDVCNGESELESRDDLASRVVYLPNQTQTSVAVFPNPASDNFTIALLKGENGNAEVFSTTGQKVLGTTLHFGENNFHAELPNGVYIVHVRLSDGETISQKLLINR